MSNQIYQKVSTCIYVLEASSFNLTQQYFYNIEIIITT